MAVGGGSVPVVLSGVATGARNAHFLRSCVPKDPHLGDLPNPGIEPRSPTLQVDSLPSEPPGSLLEKLVLLYYM